MGIADTSVAAQSRARTWTRLHQHLGSAPGPLTYDMVSRAAADHLGESDDLDWKRDLPLPPMHGQWNEFAKDISAMANTRGGLLIYGVADDHEIIGIDWEKVDLRQYAQWVRNHVHPYLPDLVMFRLTDGATNLLVVDVPASEMAPHLVHGRSDKDKEQQAFTVPPLVHIGGPHGRGRGRRGGSSGHRGQDGGQGGGGDGNHGSVHDQLNLPGGGRRYGLRRSFTLSIPGFGR